MLKRTFLFLPFVWYIATLVLLVHGDDEAMTNNDDENDSDDDGSNDQNNNNDNDDHVDNDPNYNEDEDEDAVLPEFLRDWLEEDIGGFLDPRVGFSTTGLVSLQAIPKGHVVMEVPAHAEFRGFGSHQERFSVCETAWSFLLEHLSGDDESDYFPYTQFLLEFRHEKLQRQNQTPPLTYAWSDEAKEWVRDVLVGRELEPRPFGHLGLDADACREAPQFSDVLNQDDRARDLLPHVLELVAVVGWSKTLIPLLDVVERSTTNVNVIVDERDKEYGFHTTTTLVALTDIAPGTPLYTAYDSPATYFNLFGTVPPYPHRWSFQTGYEGTVYGAPHNGVLLVFEVTRDDDQNDSDDNNNNNNDNHHRYSVTWLSATPNNQQLNWFKAHRRRLLSFNVMDSTTISIANETEKQQIQLYQQMLVTDLEQAIFWARGNPYEMDHYYEEPSCPAWSAEASDSQDETCRPSSSSSTDMVQNRYDDFGHVPDRLDYNTGVHHSCYNPISSSDVYESRKSHYQSIEWAQYLNPDSHQYDTCLLLNDIIHSCVSIRPQVHEPIMHYPASFLDKVQRVLFVGGGDLIILHEILKYPSLELVIGMELDQDVVRSSFRHYGVLPHFDSTKVKWWFGDASKSLSMLDPEEYFGTFDLVFIDLLSYIFDNLRVGDEHELLTDYMMKLLKPDGILVRQEDFVSHNIVDFAKYTLEYTITGLPYICQQSFTIGSHALDFTKKKRMDRNIETIFFNSSYTDNHTKIWSGFSRNKRRLRKSFKAKNETAKNDDNTPIIKSRHGVLVIIEAEKTSVSSKDATSVRNDISQAIAKSGLTEQAVESYTNVDSNQNYTLLFILAEGYVVARIWPEHAYCAFDLQLWNDIRKHERAAAELVAAVGGDWERSTSWFQITTGGIFGLDRVVVSDEATKPTWFPDPLLADETMAEAPLATELFDAVLDALSSSLMPDPDPVLVVICADQSVACKSLDALSGAKTTTKYTLVPLAACSPPATVDAPDNALTLLECEQQARSSLRAATKGQKISGVVIDSNAPMSMGQIIHKIFNNSLTRHETLDEQNFLILAPMEQNQGASWRNELLERFRAQIVIFNPVFHSNVVFNNTQGSLEIGIFKYGDYNYHAHLIDCLEGIHEKTLLDYRIDRSITGVMNHVPDFGPEKVTLAEEYNVDAARQQWEGQKPMGKQFLLQFQVQPILSLQVGDPVMINVYIKSLSGIWCPGKVVKPTTTGRYVVETIDGQKLTTDRTRLRIMDDYTTMEPLEFGDFVFRKESEGAYTQAIVIELHEDGSYTAQEFSDGDVYPARRSDLVRSIEKPIAPDLPAMSCSQIETAMQDILGVWESKQAQQQQQQQQQPQGDETPSVASTAIQKLPVGDGCLLVAFLANGGMIVSWDGRIHVDVNIFLDNAASDWIAPFEIKSILARHITNATTVQHDSHPRGYGRVVNFLEDLDETWFGIQLESEP